MLECVGGRLTNAEYAVSWKQAQRKQRACERARAAKLLNLNIPTESRRSDDNNDEPKSVISFNTLVEGQGRDVVRPVEHFMHIDRSVFYLFYLFYLTPAFFRQFFHSLQVAALFFELLALKSRSFLDLVYVPIHEGSDESDILMTTSVRIEPSSSSSLFNQMMRINALLKLL